MFGRAGRPQFDTEGHVFALAHEDDVRLAKWQVKFDSIPEDAKDPKLLVAKKNLLKKKPTRRAGFTYWNPEQFTTLQTAPPVRLASKGRLTWRWLAYLLDANPAVEPIRDVIRRRLMDQPTIDAEIKRLTKMLVTLAQMNVVTLDPPAPEAWKNAIKPGQSLGSAATEAPPRIPPEDEGDDDEPNGHPERSVGSSPESTGPSFRADPSVAARLPQDDTGSEAPAVEPRVKPPTVDELMARLKLGEHIGTSTPAAIAARAVASGKAAAAPLPGPPPYDPLTATPTARLTDLPVFRAVHPLYGLFLMDHLSIADDAELVQILESLLEMPGSVAKSLRVPWPDDLPPGRLSTEVVVPAILTRGLATQEDLYPQADQSDIPPELRKYPVPLAHKMRMLFESEIDHAGGLFVTPVWGVGDLLAHGGDFDKFVRARDLIKQEGILFKHLLRMILLCGEFAQLTPRDTDPLAWQSRLNAIADTLTTACRTVDPQSTDELLEELGDEV
jgi:hypothetical protein